MTKLKLTVTGVELKAELEGYLTAGMVGVPYEVTYDRSWENLSRIAVFQAGSITRDAVDGIIPWEVLADPLQPLRVGLVGRKADGTVVIPTIWADVGQILRAADETGDPGAEPDNPVWAQSAALAQQALDLSNAVVRRADSGEFQGAPGPQGEPYIHSEEFSELAGQVRTNAEQAAQARQSCMQEADRAKQEADRASINTKSAYQTAVEGGYTGTEEEFAAELKEAALLTHRDTTGWQPVTVLDGSKEKWEKGYYWTKNGEKVSTEYTKKYYASGILSMEPDCDYDILGLSGDLWLYQAAGDKGELIQNHTPAQHVSFHTKPGQVKAAVNTFMTGNWFPQNVMIKRTSPSKAEYAALPGGGDKLKPLYGKTVVCFGDSLFGMHRGDTSAPAYAARVCGATVHNVGFGGCRMAVHPTAGYAEFSMYALARAAASGDWSAQDAAAASGSSYFPQQLAQLKTIDFQKADIAVIHYGTNDFTGNVDLESDDPRDIKTICGALRESIEQLLGAFPRMQLYISLPVYRFWTEGTVQYAEEKRNSKGYRLEDICKALAAAAKEYHLPVIDGYHGLGINRANAAAFLEDGTHHNQAGRERFGRMIGQTLMSGADNCFAAEDTAAVTQVIDKAIGGVY